MKGCAFLFALLLHVLAVVTLPVLPAGGKDVVSDLLERAPPNPFTAFQNAANGAKGAGAGGGAKQKTAVQTAADSFAGDVATVSASINGIGNTTDKGEIRQLASQGFEAEQDENQHRAVLNGAAGNDAGQANQKIVDNTPAVLDGLQSIMRNPSMANTMKQLQTMETARNKNILPSITQLSNGAFQNAGVDGQAQTFEKTTGVQNMKQTMAAAGAK